MLLLYRLRETLLSPLTDETGTRDCRQVSEAGVDISTGHGAIHVGFLSVE